MRTAHDQLGARVRESQSILTELVGSRRLKLSLTESMVDWIEDSKNLETCVLNARKFGCKLINRLSVSVPGQRQLAEPNSTAGIIVSRGAKFDIVICTTVRSRKGLLDTFVEPRGKRCQVFGSIEFGILQLLWQGLSDQG